MRRTHTLTTSYYLVAGGTWYNILRTVRIALHTCGTRTYQVPVCIYTIQRTMTGDHS